MNCFELYRKPRLLANRDLVHVLCYNSTVSQQLTYYETLRGKRLKRAALILCTVFTLLWITSCGGSNSTGTVSGLTHRAFISNPTMGILLIMDTAHDSIGTNIDYNTGSYIPYSIRVGNLVTWMVLSPDKTTTLAYQSSIDAVWFVNNQTETTRSSVTLSAAADMALWSPDNKTVYAPVRNVAISNAPLGGIQVIDVGTAAITTTWPVPAARWAALSPSGQYLLVFADNSDSAWLIDTTASTVAAVQIPGFARPVGAFFSSDNNTAYVLNCGPECGSNAGPPSVASLDIPSKTIKATVPVGGASVGYLNNSTLYVAGSPTSHSGTFDAINVGNMTRTTTNPVVIGDGYHSIMALSGNNKLYIGASTCQNVTSGCLSVVDVTNNTAAPPMPPNGAVTGLQAIPNRNTMYVIEGGYLHIYDTTTDKLQAKQYVFSSGYGGTLYGVVQVE